MIDYSIYSISNMEIIGMLIVALLVFVIYLIYKLLDKTVPEELIKAKRTGYRAGYKKCKMEMIEKIYSEISHCENLDHLIVCLELMKEE